MKNKIITLLTDFGTKDGFVGTMKGVILSINPKVELVDLTHEISPHNILEASIALRTSYHFFPRGTIHLVVVDPGVGSQRRSILVETEKYYFIGPDNGILSFALENEEIKKIIELSNKKYFLRDISNTFHGRDIFAPVAAYLARGTNIKRFGQQTKEYKKFTLLTPRIHPGGVIGKVIYVDHFGNLVTNIGAGLALKLAQKRVLIKINNRKIERINKSYADTKPGELTAVIGSNDCLEIAVNQGNAFQVLKPPADAAVEITVPQ